jgi:hypothetical protein
MRPFTAGWSRRLAVLTAAMTLTGCYGTRQSPALPVPVRLVSPTGYEVVQRMGNGTDTARCTVRSADLAMTALRGDTLFFSGVKVRRPSPMAPPLCVPTAPGFVLLAAHPDLRIEQGMLHSGRTWLSVLLVVPTVFLALLIIAVTSDGG